MNLFYNCHFEKVPKAAKCFKSFYCFQQKVDLSEWTSYLDVGPGSDSSNTVVVLLEAEKFVKVNFVTDAQKSFPSVPVHVSILQHFVIYGYHEFSSFFSVSIFWYFHSPLVCIFKVFKSYFIKKYFFCSLLKFFILIHTLHSCSPWCYLFADLCISLLLCGITVGSFVVFPQCIELAFTYSACNIFFM